MTDNDNYQMIQEIVACIVEKSGGDRDVVERAVITDIGALTGAIVEAIAAGAGAGQLAILAMHHMICKVELEVMDLKVPARLVEVTPAMAPAPVELSEAVRNLLAIPLL